MLTMHSLSAADAYRGLVVAAVFIVVVAVVIGAVSAFWLYREWRVRKRAIDELQRFLRDERRRCRGDGE